MIIVLEGANGTGKSALAKALSANGYGEIYRAFRSDSDEHFEVRAGQMRMLGVPVNTFVEDAFAADLLGRLDVPMILDRSMPSGVAYLLAEGGLGSEAQLLLSLWVGSLRKRTVLIVHMKANLGTRMDRARGRRFDWHIDSLVEREIREAIQAVSSLDPGIHILEIDTTEKTKDQTAREVVEFIDAVDACRA